nr:hypothetical protein [Tanacetum cinerariifolium]GEV47288.1 hypothetical protein [Tanacetum cinerariifolium]
MKSAKERRRKSNERMMKMRKLAAGNPNSLEKILARIEANKKKNKKNGFVDDHTVEYDLRKLRNEAIAIKEHLKMILNNNSKKDTHSLLRSIENIIQIVTHFYEETRDVPYNWMGRRFIPELKRGAKIAYPKSHEDNEAECKDVMGNLTDPTCFIYFDESDDDNEEECVDVKGTLTEPNCYTLGRLDRTTPDVCSELGTGRLSDIIRNVYYPNEFEEKIWKEYFKEFDKETLEVKKANHMCIEEELMSIKVDHPMVRVIGNFAVEAFNKACEMHVKNGEHNNLHDFELMECKYIKTSLSYYFYMAIEAIEEGKLGIYEAKVICNSFGHEMILCQFVLTDRTPFGTKAMAVKYLACPRSIFKTVDDLWFEKLTRLKALSKSLGGDERCKAQVYKDLLKQQHNETVEGLKRDVLYTTALHRSLNQNTRLPDCYRTTNPDAWSHPDDGGSSGMVLRATGTTCRGYDLRLLQPTY